MPTCIAAAVAYTYSRLLKNSVFHNLLVKGLAMEEKSQSERIGEFLVRIGALTPEKVEEILRIQEDEGKLFGIIAIEHGFIDDNAVKAYLDSKR